MKELKFLFIAFVVTLQAGCAQVPPSSTPVRQSDTSQIYMTPSVQRYLIVNAVRERLDPQGLMEVSIELMNIADQSRDFIYRMDWKDKDGFSIESVMSGQQKASVASKTVRPVNFIAPHSRASQYRLHIYGDQDDYNSNPGKDR